MVWFIERPWMKRHELLMYTAWKYPPNDEMSVTVALAIV